MTTHASGRQTVELRTATERDIEALVALVGFHGLNPARLRRRFETDLSEDESHMVVAMAGGELVGYGRCAWFTHPPQTPTNVAPEGYYMGGLLVETSSRRRGIGEALTRAGPTKSEGRGPAQLRRAGPPRDSHPRRTRRHPVAPEQA